MTRRHTAGELERAAARRRAPPAIEPLPGGEPLAMLVRRGLHPRLAAPDLPFPPGVAPAAADRIAERLSHYAFRLFLRGAILARGPFRPAEATRYLTPAQAGRMAVDLFRLGLAEPTGDGRFRLRHPARSFGGTLEWWVGRELARRLDVAVATGVRSGAPGVGGDLDLVAALEGKLLYVELKSSPPKHVSREELRAFMARIRALRPHLAILAVDTALRLRDKVLPDLAALVPGARPVRLLRENHRIAPGLYVVNARQDLVENLCVVVADRLKALAPEPP
ncbi:hypothetical protein [Anaeromyxobacter oryzisoli]|uniref:hypothetical protein n=1 Tax=Anaeromyxobacter oryzisoli TaxID=2925408 RepID=UPI001F586711|nr:hypothetical protein [Anaeromyxobacter sp. SG63]